jgi:hypothetical protein
VTPGLLVGVVFPFNSSFNVQLCKSLCQLTIMNILRAAWGEHFLSITLALALFPI